MKKILMILMATVLLAACLPCALAEEAADEPSPLGDWYADVSGLTLRLTLMEDGSYLTETLAQAGEPGQWAEIDGEIRLDGDTSAPLYFFGDSLVCLEDELIFLRTPPEGYVPAPVWEGVGDFPMLYEGHWISEYVDVERFLVPARVMDESTELWIECEIPTVEGTEDAPVIRYGDALVAMAGELFGDSVQRFVLDGDLYVLNLEEDGASVTLVLLQDGMLRLSLVAPDANLTLYLSRVPTETEEDVAEE